MQEKIYTVSRTLALKRNTSYLRCLQRSIYEASNAKAKILEQLAAKPLIRLTPYQMLFAGQRQDGTHLLKGSAYLTKELPKRFSHLITTFQSLPYIVMCNDRINNVFRSYHKAFDILHKFGPVQDNPSAVEYSKILVKVLDGYNNELTSLALGFKECKKYMEIGDLGRFLDAILKSYLGIKILAEHYVALHHPKLKDLIKGIANHTTEICEFKHGISPEIALEGDADDHFSYIPAPLEYILFELLKNATEATAKKHSNTSGVMPKVVITISNCRQHFYIRIADQGGGLSREKISQAMQYLYTTSNFNKDTSTSQNLFRNIMENETGGPAAGPMSGFGFGLPVSQAYAEYMGGSLTLQSIPEYGTDVYLQLQHIDKKECFKV